MRKVGLLGVLFLLSLPDQAQDSTDILKRQVTTNKSEYQTTHSSFLESLMSARVPGGIVTILNCDNTHPKRQIAFSPGTVRETLDAIVRANPEYRWQVDEGVINLLPATDEPALLKVRINKLKVEDAQSIDRVLDNLLELPEVRTAITNLQLTPGVKLIIGPVAMDPERRPKFTVEFENVMIREALNAIVRAYGRALWEYKEQRCDGKTIFNVDFIAKWL